MDMELIKDVIGWMIEYWNTEDMDESDVDMTVKGYLEFRSGNLGETRNAVLGDSYERYELIRDYEDPCGTISKGVIKTEYQWMARFALLNPGDCKIKKDWFKLVEIK